MPGVSAHCYHERHEQCAGPAHCECPCHSGALMAGDPNNITIPKEDWDVLEKGSQELGVKLRDANEELATERDRNDALRSKLRQEQDENIDLRARIAALERKLDEKETGI